MIIHNDPLLTIYFGDIRACFQRDFLMNDCSQEELWSHESMQRLKKIMKLDSLVMLKQKHSMKGVCVVPERMDELLSSKPEGDFLISQMEHTGLAVYTADCLPIVFFDTCNRVAGICHAGWVGSIGGVAIKTIESMQKEYGTDLNHVRIFFGPSAKRCCYEVTEEFEGYLKGNEQVLIRNGEKLFFDLPLYNRLLLEEYGLKKEAFHGNYNVCTICNLSFCSNRREKELMRRQLAVVALK